ncbi:hypothetical protein GCK72_004428 [Caenorhabditis remanei]|uniref:Uncharacterized protein n=1 Tax=Caenorhabditis remanei TaxID=31234 RepID=A0A6A5H9H8_CAERE|nr:hypothetical protein GCK72_004428 [Caenorhabditis remanei]KAF1764480.1 hypothetical protein GCK72_004428 [Caenorhabditis remanei]
MNYPRYTFTQAQSVCESLCGNLVSIHSGNEMRYIKNYYAPRSTESIYIGAITVSGKYNSWTDGTAWDYNNIDNSQSWQATSNCMMVSLSSNGTQTNDAWYHTSCDTARPFMCKRKVGTDCGSDYSTTTLSTGSPSPSDTTPTCTSFLMSPGTFSSPGYPGNYTNNLNCAFTLATLGAYRIRLSFNSFVTENNYDKVRIYDGDSADSQFMAQLTGAQNSPLYYESTGNMMYVTFTTDGSVVMQGFTANFLSLI